MSDDSSFKLKPWVTARVSNTQKPRQTLVCPLCPDRRLFSSSLIRDSHLASAHDGEKAFGCQSCGESFTLFSALVKHTEKQHSKEKPATEVFEDPSRADLPYKCVVCKVGFNQETVLQRHYDTMHTLDEGEQYHCPVCYFTYSGCRTRDDHVLKKHPEARAFKCPMCEARFTSFEVFRAHEKRAHISQKTYAQNRGLSEPLSSLGLQQPQKPPRRKLAAAMRSALGEKDSDLMVKQLVTRRRVSRVYKEGTLLCEICGEDCANDEEMEIHSKDHHHRKEERFACSECARVFLGSLARSFLVDHIRIEHMHQSPYVCDDCNQRFLYKVQADRHRTVDRDSGVTSCRRAEDLPLSLPRLLFGCRRCAKIFAGEGAQSRYTEHDNECLDSPPPPLPRYCKPKLGALRPEPKLGTGIKRPFPVPPPLTDPYLKAKSVFNAPKVPEDSFSEPLASTSQEAASGMIMLPESGCGEGLDNAESGEMLVLPEDVFLPTSQDNGSVIVIQAADGTLFLANEEQLSALQMTGAEHEAVLQEDDRTFETGEKVA